MSTGSVQSLALLRSLFFIFVVINQYCLYFLKITANKTNTESKVKQNKSETYSYKLSNHPTVQVIQGELNSNS